MKRILRLLRQGIPLLINDFRASLSVNTGWFIAVPRSIYIGFGNHCNAFCTMCWLGRRNREGKPPDNKPLSEEFVIKLLKEVKALSGRGALVSLSAGEPLLYKPLYKMMNVARGLGLNLSFTTNGYLLNEETVKKIALAEPFGVGVSIESLDPAVNELLRPYKNGEGTRLTIRGIELLLKARHDFKKNFRINIKTLITQANMASFPEIVRRFGKENGVLITPQPYYEQEGATEEERKNLWVRDTDALASIMEEVISLKHQGYNVNVDESGLRNFVRYYQKSQTKEPERRGADADKGPWTCFIGHTTLFVNADGEIKLCPDMEVLGSLGNGKSLRDLWYGEAAQRVRRKIRLCKCHCELSCTRQTSILERIRTFLRSG